MTRREKIAIGMAVVAAAAVLVWANRTPPSTPDVSPGHRRLGIGGYPGPGTDTPSPSGGVFPTPDPDFLPSEIIPNYDDFGDYAGPLGTAEAAIESGVPGVAQLGETEKTWVRECDVGEGFGFYPASRSARLILMALLRNGTPRVQGMYRDGEDVFTMFVTGLTAANVSWPSTPTLVPTPTGTPTPGFVPRESRRRPVHDYVPAAGYAVGVSLIVPADPGNGRRPGRPMIQGLYACQRGYYTGVRDLFFGWNIDSIYYARN